MLNDESLLSSVSKMLGPTSPAQKNLSEEDSSGSDAGSEVGQEPETDRFGFILTNGSTAGWAVTHVCSCAVYSYWAHYCCQKQVYSLSVWILSLKKDL